MKTAAMAAVVLWALAAAAGARAAPVADAAAPPPVRVGEVAGSAGQWQEGSVTVDAPIEEVRAWLLDIAGWPRRFPDVTTTRVLKHTSPNVWIVAVHSRLLGDVAIRLRASPGKLVYGGAPGERGAPEGLVLIRALDPQRTVVTMRMRTPPRAHKAKKQRTVQKLQADLAALQALSAEHRAQP